jgi:hypothetical protein
MNSDDIANPIRKSQSKYAILHKAVCRKLNNDDIHVQLATLSHYLFHHNQSNDRAKQLSSIYTPGLAWLHFLQGADEVSISMHMSLTYLHTL